jgi:hypothetical protein
MWIPYKSFVDFVFEGYEIIENLAAYSDTVKFAGFARVEILSGAASRTAALTFTDSGFYQTAEALPEGTEFRFVAGADESAYMYAFAVSQQPGTSPRTGGFYSPVQLFPQAGVSALLNYPGSAVALPGEDKTLVLDADPGLEYLVLLYAKQALDMRALMRRFENAKGTTPHEKLAAALGENLLAAGALSYREGEAAFSVEAGDGKAVAALVLAINHVSPRQN